MSVKERRTVTLCEHTEPNAGLLGRGPRLWAFGYADLAQLFQVSEGAVRQAVHDGRLDPSNLKALCESWRYGVGRKPAPAAQLRRLSPEEEAELLRTTPADLVASEPLIVELKE